MGRALGLGGVIVPADGVDGGLNGLVVVVKVQPADRQVGLVEEHELVAVAGLGLHGDPVDRVAVLGVARGLLADDVEVDAELVHYGWVNAADISTGSTGTATSYRVRTTADVLNIRKGPGTNYGVAGQIKGKGIYTIVAEAAGPGATKWGKLKSGAGWISLDYVTKL